MQCSRMLSELRHDPSDSPSLLLAPISHLLSSIFQFSVRPLIAAQNDGVSGAVEKSRPQNEQVWQELSLPGCLGEQMRHTSESLLSLPSGASHRWNRISRRLRYAG